MRQEMYEYQFDWMMNNSFEIVLKAAKNSDMEREQMFKYLPYFNKSLNVLYDQGAAQQAFLDLLGRWINDYYFAEEYGRKRVLSTFIKNPMILYAMNLCPINSELLTVFLNFFYHRGGFDFMDLCVEKGFTETSCSAQRGSMGAYLAGMAKDFDIAIVNSPGTCDSNANAFAFLSNYFDKPFYCMDIPSRIPAEDVHEYERKDFRAMLAFIEKHTGHTVDFDKLKRLLEETNVQQELIIEIQEMMTVKPSPMPSFWNFMLYVGYNIMLGRPEFTVLLKAIHKKVKENLAAGIAGTPTGRERVRLLMLYIDHYQSDISFYKWLDDAEISHLGMTVSHTFYKGQPYLKGNETMGWSVDTSSEAAMIDSCVDLNARQPMARSIRGPISGPNQWLEESLTMLNYYQADAAIYMGTYGCRNTWSAIQPLTREIEKHGYPTFIVTSDGFDERAQSWMASQAQLEEFLKVRGIV